MRTGTLVKSMGVFLIVAVGGPALTMYITPTEEELFKKYNPELQRRSLEGREQRLKEANEFVEKLKKYSKSDKPIWTVWQEDADRQKNDQLKNENASKLERKSIAEEMRKQRMEGNSRASVTPHGAGSIPKDYL